MLYVRACASNPYPSCCLGLTVIPTTIPSSSTTVHLDKNQISRVPAGVFSQLSNCIHLGLANNSISQIERGAFRGLEKLQVLSLGWNKITEIPADIPPSVTEIYLHNNNITRIPVGVLGNLSNCRHLELANNQISLVEPGAIEGLENLETLYLGWNKISEFPEDVPTGVKKLFFQSNGVTITRANVFRNLTQCTHLNLDLNMISQITDFTGLDNLKLLSLASNRLQSVPNGIPASVTELYLYSNGITQLPANTFANLSQCTKISLSGNQISVVELGAFRGLTRLENLDLAQNHITGVDLGTFAGLTRLKRLDLDFNRITSLDPGLFEGLTKLEWLELGENQLTEVKPGLFLGLKSLHTIDLDENRITTLDSSLLFGLPRPLKLFLSDPREGHEGDEVWDCRRLCWMKVEEKAGNITWDFTFQGNTLSYAPECSDGSDWADFNCDSKFQLND